MITTNFILKGGLFHKTCDQVRIEQVDVDLWRFESLL